jgi:hypothetical protein
MHQHNAVPYMYTRDNSNQLALQTSMSNDTCKKRANQCRCMLSHPHTYCAPASHEWSFLYSLQQQMTISTLLRTHNNSVQLLPPAAHSRHCKDRQLVLEPPAHGTAWLSSPAVICLSCRLLTRR